jgi:hypothetical protein
MGLNGFLFNFVALGWMLSLTVIGGFVLILAWAIKFLGTLGPDKLIFLRFAVAVIVNPIGLILLDLVSKTQHRAIFADLIIVSSIAIGMASLIGTISGLQSRDDASSKVLRNGTRFLLVCAGLALLGIVAGIPGELTTWKS